MVKWTDHALSQLRHIHDHIAQDSPLYARRVSEALVGKTLTLEKLPRLGRKVPELSEETVREIKPAHIDVLAVIHTRRDLQPEDIPREQ
jgi:plasmid stabilization system protein ParE